MAKEIVAKGCLPAKTNQAPSTWRMPFWIRKKILSYGVSEPRSNDSLFPESRFQNEIAADVAFSMQKKQDRKRQQELMWDREAAEALRRLAEGL